MPLTNGNELRHAGCAACVLGAGPSLAGFDPARCGRAVTYGVNDAGPHFGADYMALVDLSAYRSGPRRRLVEEFGGRVLAPAGFDRFFRRDIVEVDQDGIRATAALAAAQAFAAGCRPIYLLGLDYRLGPHGETHCYPRPGGNRRHTEGDLERLRDKTLDPLLRLRIAGAGLINVTPFGPDGPWSRLGWAPAIDLDTFDLRYRRALCHNEQR